MRTLRLVAGILTVPVILGCDQPTPPASPASSAPVDTARIGPAVHTPIPRSRPSVRIRLQRIEGELEPVEFGPSGTRFRISDPAGTTIVRRGPVRILRDGQGWLLRGGEALPSAMVAASFLRIEGDRPIELKDDTGETRRYGGTLSCLPVPAAANPTWDLIEHVDIESYLPGVLAGELYGHWGKQCQAAQAIAARSYVTMTIHERRNRSWDVVDTAASQVYLGEVMDPVSRAAVRMTDGMILTWGDEVVPGYFSSCCGGRAATASEAIGPNPINALRPLGGHDGDGHCQQAPLFSWRRTVDGEKLASLLRNRAGRGSDLRNMKRIRTISVSTRNQHGRGVELALTDSSGATYRVSAAGLLSASRGLPRGSLYSGWVEGETSSEGLQLSGRGYGHGAGLCQYGAAAMDDAGQSFWQIIEYYYPGAEVKKAW